MIVTCCSTTDRFSGDRNLPGAANEKITTPNRRTMKGIEVGIVVQEGLNAAHRARAIFLEARDRLVGTG